MFLGLPGTIGTSPIEKGSLPAQMKSIHPPLFAISDILSGGQQEWLF